jgi:hypothetical protein
VIEERPGRYLGYFVNKFGGQLVFVHDDGDAHATVFLGDLDWEPRVITDAGGWPDAGDLMLNKEEGPLVIGCWIATACGASTLRLVARRCSSVISPSGVIGQAIWSGLAPVRVSRSLPRSRWLSPLRLRISEWWMSRSIIAVAAMSSPKISPHFENGLLRVTIIEARS